VACSRVSFIFTFMSGGGGGCLFSGVLLCVFDALGLCFILWIVHNIITVNSLLERRVLVVKFLVQCQGSQYGL